MLRCFEYLICQPSFSGGGDPSNDIPECSIVPITIQYAKKNSATQKKIACANSNWRVGDDTRDSYKVTFLCGWWLIISADMITGSKGNCCL